MITRARFVWIPTGILLLAGVFGVAAGASVSMYYDLVPSIGSQEDLVSSVLGALYVVAIVFSFAYLPAALAAATTRQGRAAALLALVVVAPLGIFLAAEGLLSHSIFWTPISDTDRFHILHHSLLTGLPLAVIYYLALRLLWDPQLVEGVPKPTTRVLAVSFICVALPSMLGTILTMGLQLGPMLIIAGLISTSVIFLSHLMAG